METTYPAAIVDIASDDDEARVWRWKLSVALKLHFPQPLAFAVANENLDIHYIENLVTRGCPPRLAVEIARP